METAVTMADRIGSKDLSLLASFGENHCRHHAMARARHWLTYIALAGLCFSQSAAAEPEALKLKQIKAAFVLNIAKFVTWPKQVYLQRPNQLLLCYFQKDSLGSAFETIRHKTVNGRSIQKATIENLTNSAACDILLIPSDTPINLTNRETEAKKQPVLIIADMTHNNTSEAHRKGALVSLVRQGKRIGFAIDVAETKKSGLKVSSKLLKLATIVDSEAN